MSDHDPDCRCVVCAFELARKAAAAAGDYQEAAALDALLKGGPDDR